MDSSAGGSTGTAANAPSANLLDMGEKGGMQRATWLSTKQWHGITNPEVLRAAIPSFGVKPKGKVLSPRRTVCRRDYFAKCEAPRSLIWTLL